MNTMNYDNIKTSEAFLKTLKENNITTNKLKSVVFGSTAIKVIREIKKNGQPCFNEIKKSHQIWWSTKYAIEQAIEKEYKKYLKK